MPRGWFGLLIGFVLGFAVIFANFGLMLVVALFGAIGYLAQRVLAGDLDISRFTGSRND